MAQACTLYRTHHHVFTRHVFIRPGGGSSFDAIPPWYQPRLLPKFYDDTPELRRSVEAWQRLDRSPTAPKNAARALDLRTREAELPLASDSSGKLLTRGGRALARNVFRLLSLCHACRRMGPTFERTKWL